MLRPVFLCTLLAAVGYSSAAATVPELASWDRRGPALPANIMMCKALLSGGRCRGLDSLEGHLIKRGAKVVAHGVHTGGDKYVTLLREA
jgi:hypothetical protein